MAKRTGGRAKGSLGAKAAERQRKVIIEWQKTGLTIRQYAKREAGDDPVKKDTIEKRVRRAVESWFGTDKDIEMSKPLDAQAMEKKLARIEEELTKRSEPESDA
jgi:hypothetical protein